MKNYLTVLVACAMLLGGAFLCQAMPGPAFPPHPGCDEAARESFPAGLARILELSEVQKTKIQTIIAEERGKGQSQHLKESELRRQLRAAEQAASFNEQAVRNAAAALFGLETERVVSRAKTHYRISALLTAAQRSLAERLRAERDEGPAPPCCTERDDQRGLEPEDGRERR